MTRTGVLARIVQQKTSSDGTRRRLPGALRRARDDADPGKDQGNLGGRGPLIGKSWLSAESQLLPIFWSLVQLHDVFGNDLCAGVGEDLLGANGLEPSAFQDLDGT